MNTFVDQAKNLLKDIAGRSLSDHERKEQAVALAGLLLQASQTEQTAAEKQQQLLLAGLIEDKNAKLLLTEMTDQCFRTSDAARIADQLRYLLEKRGVPKKLPLKMKMEIEAFKIFSRPFPSLVVPFLKRAIRKQISAVVVPGEADALKVYLNKRKQEGFEVNLNHLGEAILGEEEADKRLQCYLNDLSHPEINCVSVKVSSICSQIHLLAWEETLERIADRLRQLYRLAMEKQTLGKDGQLHPKFINLDMEEYRDLALTTAVFTKVLDEPEFLHLSAGIALQSYIPDSFQYQQKLTHWAYVRRQKGGAPIKIRLVKGANLAMEQVEASIREWEQAPYRHKKDADTSFKDMLLFGADISHASAVHLGIASHNLFDIAFALIVRAEKKLFKEITFEMLEGMAPHMSRAVKAVADGLLLYSPTAEQKDFHTAVAYLIRRLDENTAPENFLHALFNLKVGSKVWQDQAHRFKLSCDEVGKVSHEPFRQQNRSEEKAFALDLTAYFENTPDTDWSLEANRKWILSLLKQWEPIQHIVVPLVIAGKDLYDAPAIWGFDPSRPNYPLYTYQLASADHADKAVKAAKNHLILDLQERSRLLAKVADELRVSRGHLIGAMVADCGKTVLEADVEVSEAIDFCEYYRRNAEEMCMLEDITWKPRGVILVASPWNFPCSIPVGGIAAALAAGNTVIFKPAGEAILTGWEIAKAFWRAGVSKTALQFITGEDNQVGTALIQHPDLNGVILTGATATAQHLLHLNPSLYLCAETGGKNAMIITELADRDQAVRDIVHSAFGHSGQKCSACSLLILLPEIYENAAFRQTLKDAVASLPIGSAWEMSTRINPLIKPPEGALLRGLTKLEAGEEWLLRPSNQENSPYLWSPGIKWGVKPSSFSYQNELFGPVLSVMRAENLSDAIKIANGTPYGLTTGIHSLDPREIEQWTHSIEAGNLYINRTMTGAIVARQPFGGLKDSVFGPGAKAGGPNYVAQCMTADQSSLPIHQDPFPESLTALHQYVQNIELSEVRDQLWKASVGSYSFFQNRYFNLDHHSASLLGQDNFLRYIPRKKVIVRVEEKTEFFDALRICAAALIAKSPLEMSISKKMKETPLWGNWLKDYQSLSLTEEDEETFVQRVEKENTRLVRFLQKPTAALIEQLGQCGCVSLVQPVLANGRLELLHFHQEIAISYDYHRYGYLGERHPVEEIAVPSEGICCGTNRPCCGGGFCDETG